MIVRHHTLTSAFPLADRGACIGGITRGRREANKCIVRVRAGHSYTPQPPLLFGVKSFLVHAAVTGQSLRDSMCNNHFALQSINHWAVIIIHYSLFIAHFRSILFYFGF